MLELGDLDVERVQFLAYFVQFHGLCGLGVVIVVAVLVAALGGGALALLSGLRLSRYPCLGESLLQLRELRSLRHGRSKKRVLCHVSQSHFFYARRTLGHSMVTL